MAQIIFGEFLDLAEKKSGAQYIYLETCWIFHFLSNNPAGKRAANLSAASFHALELMNK